MRRRFKGLNVKYVTSKYKAHMARWDKGLGVGFGGGVKAKSNIKNKMTVQVELKLKQLKLKLNRTGADLTSLIRFWRIRSRLLVKF